MRTNAQIIKKRIQTGACAALAVLGIALLGGEVEEASILNTILIGKTLAGIGLCLLSGVLWRKWDLLKAAKAEEFEDVNID